VEGAVPSDVADTIRPLKLGTAAISFPEFLIQEALFHGFES